MTDTLATLMLVQERDLALDRLELRRAELPERTGIATGEQAVAILDRKLAEVTARHDAVAREEQRLDDEATTLRDKAAAVKAKMYSGEVTSPKELQAMQADIESLHRHQSQLEDRELELMEAREPVDAELAQLTQERAQVLARIEELRGRLAIAEAEIADEVTAERAAREGLAAQVDAPLVAQYEKRRIEAGGVGIARLIGRTCQGCHLTLPSTDAENVRHLPDGELGFCDNCGAILVP